MLKLKIFILSWLLYQANKTKTQAVYAIKNKLLTKYGQHVGNDLQVLEKRCWTCGGSGIYIGWDPHNGDDFFDVCRHCGGTGIYETKEFVLDVVKLGKYEFHNNPIKVHNTDIKPRITYHIKIGHKATKLSRLCAGIIISIFDSSYAKQVIKNKLQSEKFKNFQRFRKLCNAADLIPFCVTDPLLFKETQRKQYEEDFRKRVCDAFDLPF